MLLVLQISPLTESEKLESFEWLTGKDKRRPTLKIGIQNETIVIPLQEAPYCRLWKTQKCNCFILKNDLNGSLERASFVECDGKVRGDFIYMNNYFQIDQDRSGEQIGEKFLLKDNLTSVSDGKKNLKIKANHTDRKKFKYFKPFPEYGQLLSNETGFVICLFVVSRIVFETIPEETIDIYLQNLISGASRYFIELGLLIVYGGWTLAFPNETIVDYSVIGEFMGGEIYKYDENGTSDVVILFAIGKISDGFGRGMEELEFCSFSFNWYRNHPESGSLVENSNHDPVHAYR